MLTRLIVSSYVWLVEAALWITIVASAVVGYLVTIPAISAAGAVATPELGWRLLGALVFSVFTFLVLAMFTGPALILVDLRQAVRNIEAKLNQGSVAGRTKASDRVEPTI